MAITSFACGILRFLTGAVIRLLVNRIGFQFGIDAFRLVFFQRVFVAALILAGPSRSKVFVRLLQSLLDQADDELTLTELPAEDLLVASQVLTWNANVLLLRMLVSSFA